MRPNDSGNYSCSLENDQYIASEHGKTLAQIKTIVRGYKARTDGWTIKIHGPDGMEMFCATEHAYVRRWKRSPLSQAKYI